MATDYQNKPGRSIPGFPKKWTFGFQLIVLLLILGANRSRCIFWLSLSE